MMFVILPFLEDTCTRTQGNSIVSDSSLGIEEPGVDQIRIVKGETSRITQLTHMEPQ